MAFFCNPFCITRVYASKSYRFVGWSMSAVALMELVIKMPGMLLGLQGAANLPDVAPGDLFGEVSLELMGRGWFAAAVMALLLVAAMAAIMSTSRVGRVVQLGTLRAWEACPSATGWRCRLRSCLHTFWHTGRPPTRR